MDDDDLDDFDPEGEIENLPVAPARNTDPSTAHAAAAGDKVARGKQRRMVHDYVDSTNHVVDLPGGSSTGGSTDYETRFKVVLPQSSACKRRGELTKAGYIVDSGRRRPTNTGRMAIVWVTARHADDRAIWQNKKFKFHTCRRCGLEDILDEVKTIDDIEEKDEETDGN